MQRPAVNAMLHQRCIPAEFYHGNASVTHLNLPYACLNHKFLKYDNLGGYLGYIIPTSDKYLCGGRKTSPYSSIQC